MTAPSKTTDTPVGGGAAPLHQGSGQQVSHTPGPWHRNIAPARKYPTIFAGRNTHIARVVPLEASGDDSETEANANLIAAAPDLLEALDMFVNNLALDAVVPQELANARCALAKARGAQS